ncbi:hypothetical protein V5F34_08545 [Xanthobacter autotrophicus]
MGGLVILAAVVVAFGLVAHLAASRALYGQRLHRVDRAFTSSRNRRA